MKRGDESVGEAADRVKNFFRDNKEECVIREEGDNENINKENTIKDGKLAHYRLGSTNPLEGLVEGTLEDVLQRNATANGNTEVSGDVAEREVGPGAGGEGGAESRIGG